jgi:RND family efflux transporter MFP subunit
VVFGAATAEEVLEYPGTLAASDRAEASFEVAGRIIEFPVKEGDQVESGQLLARLDSSDALAELEREQARVNASKAEFERQRVLFDEGVASEREFDVAKRNYEVTAAGLRIAQKAVNDSELRAPFAGRVARTLVNQFQNVQAKEPVVSFQSEGLLEIKVAVPERDAARMPVGKTLKERSDLVHPEVVVSALAGRSFPAQLTEFATSADPTTRTFAATLTFSTPEDVNVLPGMTASARVYVSDEAGIGGKSLPSSAVFADSGGTPSVWIIDPESLRVATRPVAVGEIFGDAVRVEEGIEDGEWVATTGVHQLREGMLVRRPGL